MTRPRKTETGGEQDGEEKEKVTPAPLPHQKHRRKHWDHLPDSKRKQIRSFRSPGRK